MFAANFTFGCCCSQFFLFPKIFFILLSANEMALLWFEINFSVIGFYWCKKCFICRIYYSLWFFSEFISGLFLRNSGNGNKNCVHLCWLLVIFLKNKYLSYVKYIYWILNLLFITQYTLKRFPIHFFASLQNRAFGPRKW